MEVKRNYKYRLYPTKKQLIALECQLEEARRLYNAAVQERSEAWGIKRINKVNISLASQAAQLKEIRDNGDLGLVNYSAAQNVLRRVNQTYTNFFRKVKAGEKVGYPRYKSRLRFNSYVYPNWKKDDGCRITKDGKLYAHGVGAMRIKLHRHIDGRIKCLTIKYYTGRWYAVFSIVKESNVLPHLDNSIGIDVGYKYFATLSDGSTVENPNFLVKSFNKVKRLQRERDRRKKGSYGRIKTILKLQKIHGHIVNQRSNFHHSLSRDLVNKYGTIIIEDIDFSTLDDKWFAISSQDAGWGRFFTKLAYKAEEAGRQLVKVNPKGTSLRCSCCGMYSKKSTYGKKRVYKCDYCGLMIDRDINAAFNIKELGLSFGNKTRQVTASVLPEAVAIS